MHAHAHSYNGPLRCMKIPQPCMLLGALCCALLFTGCATITRGVHESLVIETDPSGAKVSLSTGESGTTPTSFRIKRKGAVVVTVTKEGYETVVVNVTTQVAAAGAAGMAGNVLVGGLIGAGVDALSGGMLEHKPNPVKVSMVALKLPPREANPTEIKAAEPVASAPPVTPAIPVSPAATPPATEKPSEAAPEAAPIANQPAEPTETTAPASAGMP